MRPAGTSDVLVRRVEAAGLLALPAPDHVVLEGWVLRFAGGFTRRANSVSPHLHAGPEPSELGRRIAACEALYAARGLPTIFRVPSTTSACLDDALTRRGYAPAEGRSAVLWGRLDSLHADPVAHAAAVELTSNPTEAWLAAQARLGGHDAPRRAILRCLSIPAAFAGARAVAGAPLASVAFGAVHDGIVTVQMVATDPAARRQGLARRTVGALLRWARSAGAAEASLQVAADNGPALRLYSQIGLRTALYHYHYRRAPARDGPRG